jgi:hypothetical protein
MQRRKLNRAVATSMASAYNNLLLMRVASRKMSSEIVTNNETDLDRLFFRFVKGGVSKKS